MLLNDPRGRKLVDPLLHAPPKLAFLFFVEESSVYFLRSDALLGFNAKKVHFHVSVSLNSFMAP